MAMEGDQVVQEIISAEDDEVNMSLTNHTEGKDCSWLCTYSIASSKIDEIQF